MRLLLFVVVPWSFIGRRTHALHGPGAEVDDDGISRRNSGQLLLSFHPEAYARAEHVDAGVHRVLVRCPLSMPDLRCILVASETAGGPRASARQSARDELGNHAVLASLESNPYAFLTCDDGLLAIVITLERSWMLTS